MADRLFLASSSPRRKELLARAGFTFEIVNATADETPPPRIPPGEVAHVIARRKADAAKVPADGVVLAADTIVVLDDVIMGKPSGDADARRMLKLLSGRWHSVFTGFVVRKGTREESGAVETRVLFKSLTPPEIDGYLNTGEPFDKAGAYAVQGAGAALVRSIEGSWTNVVGLPLVEVIEAIERLSNLKPFAKT
jgi:septum formation protein